MSAPAGTVVLPPESEQPWKSTNAGTAACTGAAAARSADNVRARPRRRSRGCLGRTERRMGGRMGIPRISGRSRQWLCAALMGVEATAVGTPRVNASRCRTRYADHHARAMPQPCVAAPSPEGYVYRTSVLSSAYADPGYRPLARLDRG